MTFSLIKNYNLESEWNDSFNQLAMKTFDIDFTTWYKKGYNEQVFNRFSIHVHNKIVASVSTYHTTLFMDHTAYQALQIGTVMTDRAYRHQGLATQLLQEVLQHYEQEVDVFYLLANETVLDFYPKFGFERVIETQFSTKNLLNDPATTTLRRLSINSAKDQAIIERIVDQAVIQNTVFSVQPLPSISYFHILIEMPDIIYYCQQWDALLLYEIEGKTVHLYDVLSPKKVDLEKLIRSVQAFQQKYIRFYFTPAIQDAFITKQKIQEDDDCLFVKFNKEKFPPHCYIAMTTRA